VTSPKIPENKSTVDSAGLRKLLDHVHANPHGILGCHPTPVGTVIRVYRPGADAVSALPEGGAETPLEKVILRDYSSIVFRTDMKFSTTS
jgi:1,4-alpha-glucan branching enzyme